jgi:FkbM family methyltransferase
MKNLFKRITLKFIWIVLGRSRLVRFARMLSHGSRLDGANQMHLNGEMLVVDIALQYTSVAKNTPIIIDCGANVGNYTIEVGRRIALQGLSPVALHAFEPASSTKATLLSNIAASSIDVPVVVRQAALSNAAGQMTLHVVHDNAGVNSLLPNNFSPTSYTETVSVIKLDEYCNTEGLERILLLKIDTEGNDYNVLDGARELLTRGAIELVQFEYNYRWIYARRFLRDVFELALATDMRLGKVTPHGIEFYSYWHPELETYTEGNYLLCRPVWVDRFPRVEWWGHGFLKNPQLQQSSSNG